MKRSSRIRGHVHEPAHGRVVIVSLAVLAMLGSLAGCGRSSASPDASGSASTGSSSPRSSSSSASATGSPSSSSTTSSGAKGGTCTTSQLSASLGQPNGAAGSTYVPLILTNHGQTCTTEGFPGVSLTVQGRQIGAAAARDGSSAPGAISLANGQSASATLRIVQAGNFDSATCSPTSTDAIRVYPPDQKAFLTIATTDYTGCASTAVKLLTISALKSGTGN
ncbi:MAG: DUF4232 domain-containing protein [Bifidobacterium sp.]|jgi:hypothetical protein|nr:DUF4232 domain-containing protein [Bifidobacterium sp.]